MQVGKEFDALIIDTDAPQGAPTFDTFEEDTIEVWNNVIGITPPSCGPVNCVIVCHETYSHICMP